MKRAIISLLIGAAIGFLLVVMFKNTADGDLPEPNSFPDRISILGNANTSKIDIPTTFLLRFSEAQELLLKIDTASRVQLKQWLSQAQIWTYDSLEVMELVVARLATQDPQDTLAFLQTLEITRRYYPIAVAEWARTDVSGAIDALLAIDSGGEDIENMVELLSLEERELVYQDLIARGFDKQSPGSFANLFVHLVDANPKEAAERALEFQLLNNGFGTRHSIGHVLSRWYGKDPDAAFEWIINQENPEARRTAMGAISEAVVQRDGVEGFERVWDYLERDQRSHLVRNIYGFSDRIDETLEWASENIGSPEDHRQLLSRLLYGLTRTGQPEDVVKILSRWETDRSKANLPTHVTAISERWAKQDIASFEKWMQSLDDPVVQGAAQSGMINHLMAEDPLKAIAYWGQNSDTFAESVTIDDTMLTEMIGSVFEEAGERNPQALLDRLPQEWHDQAMWMYAWHYSENDPVAGVRFFEALPPGEGRDRGLQMAIGYWATQEPDRVVEWVNELGHGEERELASRNLATNWVRTDPDAAITWLRDQPASEHRDLAAKEIFETSFLAVPELSLELLGELSSAADRANFLTEHLPSLIRRDPDLLKELMTRKPEAFEFAAGSAERIAEQIEQELTLQAELSDQ